MPGFPQLQSASVLSAAERAQCCCLRWCAQLAAPDRRALHVRCGRAILWLGSAEQERAVLTCCAASARCSLSACCCCAARCSSRCGSTSLLNSEATAALVQLRSWACPEECLRIQTLSDKFQICMWQQTGAWHSSQAFATEDGASKMTDQHPAGSFSASLPAQASHLPPEEAVCHPQTVSAWLAGPARFLQGPRPRAPQSPALQRAAGPACEQGH